MIDRSPSFADTLLRQLPPRGESRRLEFKRVSGEMVGEALETVCADANTQGGTLVLGMADLKETQGSARLFGVEENPAAVDELQSKLLSEFQPAIGGLRAGIVSSVAGYRIVLLANDALPPETLERIVTGSG